MLHSIDRRGEFPLGMTLRDDQTRISSILDDHGADVNFEDANSWTLLHKKAAESKDEQSSMFSMDHRTSVILATDDTSLHLIAA